MNNFYEDKEFENDNPTEDVSPTVIDGDSEPQGDENTYYWNADDVQMRVNNQIPDHKSLNIVKPKIKKSRKGYVTVLVIALIGSIIGSVLTSCLFMFTPLRYYKPGTSVYTNTDRTPDSVDPSIIPEASGRELTNSEIHEKVGPAVVGITNKSISTNIFMQQRETKSSGSGIIISADGYIITNNHVIEGSNELTVSLITGETYPAKLIGNDSQTDLAVIKVDVTNLPYAVLGDSSQLKAGERVVAIGNPLMQELAGTITAGILSATNRTLTVTDQNANGTTTSKKMTLLQTDAAINPGNSGGALINAYGEVIGINTLKTMSSGVEGVGFAIPINEAKPIIDSLIEQGYVSRPAIGITIVTVTEQLSRQHDLPEGLYIQSITQFSSAERAGLKIADVILKCNGEVVKTADELNEIKNKHKVGDVLTLTINRNGEVFDIELTLLEDKSAVQVTEAPVLNGQQDNYNNDESVVPGYFPFDFWNFPGFN